MSQRVLLQAASAVVIVVTGVVFVSSFTAPATEVLDHHNYRVAIEGIREGQGYYPSYDIGFREVYGPIPAARDVRFPTLYMALSWTPEGSEHVAFAIMAVISGLVTAALAKAPPTGAVVTLYLLTLAVADNGSAQFLYAELWLVPLVIGAVLALDRGHDLVALGLAALAFAVREQGILLLGGIATHMWVSHRHRRFAAGALIAAVAGYAIHVSAVRPFLDPENGVHTPLHLGWGPVDSFLRTLGFGLDMPWLGVLFLLGAVVWSYRHRLMLAIGPFLAMPLVTLWANRPYWGVMVVPLAIVLTIDSIWEAFFEREQSPAQPSIAPASQTGAT